MTEKERAEWQRRCLRFQETLAGNPPPSLETRLDWLEADASAQRTAILKLEQDNRWHRTVISVLVVYIVTLPIVWMLNFPPPSVMP